MTLQQLVDALDAQVVKGDIITAFDKFAAENCATLSTPADKTHSKAQKLDALQWFFNNVATTNRIERLAAKVGKNVTDSQFVFDFTDKLGNRLVFNEVIRRTWKGDKMVEEQYLMNQTIENEQPAAAAAPAKKPVAKAAKTTVKADDLALIEGVGPKIAELLNAAGITTFAKLADTKPSEIKAILEAAGKRYQMHDPATWPKQAALARDGKTAELAKLQDQLKAGRK
jgi:predicted flap endonuclease-1-like 5' DNA nuclease